MHVNLTSYSYIATELFVVCLEKNFRVCGLISLRISFVLYAVSCGLYVQLIE